MRVKEMRLEIEHIILERIRFLIDHFVAEEQIEDGNFDAQFFTDQMFNAFRVSLKADFLAHKIKTAEISTPKTWWDHWKVEHPKLTARFKLREPKFDVKSVSVYDIYPALDAKKFGQAYRYVVMEDKSK